MNIFLAGIELPVQIALTTALTDDEFLWFCASNDAWRVEREPNGELLVMSPAGSGSSGRNMEISTDLNLWTRRDGRGKAFDSSAGFSLPDGSMRSPDAAWISLDRWSALSKEAQEGFGPICPDFVIELRSPSDGLSELKRKMDQWIGNGAQLGWLIDPLERTVSIYRPGQQPELRREPTSVQGDGVMAGFELVMTRIWE